MSHRIRVLNKQALLDRIAKCKEILEANPSSQIFAALAEAYRKIGDLKSALDVCNDGLKLHPDYGSAHMVLAKVARDQKRFDEAEKATLRGIELDGSTRSAELLLSDIYIQTGKFPKAEEILVRLAAADPSNQPVQKLLTLARRASKAQAVEDLGSTTDAIRPSELSAHEAPNAPAIESSATGHRATGDKAPGDDVSWEVLFDSLGRYPHLLGKLAVSYDGMLLQTDIEIRSEAEAAAAMTAEMYHAVQGDWPERTFGPLEQLLIETEQATWWFWPFPQFLLVLWCEPSLNMGPLRMRIAHVEGVSADSISGGSR